MTSQQHSAWEKTLGSAQPLQREARAIPGQQVGPGHSYLLQQQPFGASTWRSGGTFSPSGLGCCPRLWAPPGARWSGWLRRTGATGEAPAALLPSANASITYVGTDALRVEPSRSAVSRSHLPESLASALKWTHIIAPPSPPRAPNAPKPPNATALTPKNAGARLQTGRTTSSNVHGIL